MSSPIEKTALATACAAIKSTNFLIRLDNNIKVCKVANVSGTQYLAESGTVKSVLSVPANGKCSFYISAADYVAPERFSLGLAGAIWSACVDLSTSDPCVHAFGSATMTSDDITHMQQLISTNIDLIVLKDINFTVIQKLPSFLATELEGNISILPGSADFNSWMGAKMADYKMAEECRGMYRLKDVQGYPVLGDRKAVSNKLIVLSFIEKMVQTIKASYDDGDDAELINNCLLYGPSAGGKSVAVQVAAVLMDLPFYGFNVGPGTTEVALFGGFVPKTNDTSDLYAAKYAEEYGKLCEGITDYDIEVTPDEILRKLGYTPGIEELQEDMSNRLRELLSRVKDNSVPSDSTVAGQFRYAISTFIQCFAYGGIIDFAEGQLSQNQALLGALNSGLSDGYVIMPMSGQVIRRHPHCIIVMTGNIGVGHFGAKQLTQSVYSRLMYKAVVPDLLPDEMAAIASKKFGPEAEKQIGVSIKNMAIAFCALRTAAKSSNVADVSGTLCGRTFSSWVQQSRRNGIMEAAKTTIVPSSSQVIDNQKKVWDLLKPILENLVGGKLV